MRKDLDNAPQAQQGVVLLIGMAILLMLTLLGISATSNATLELKMATNSQEMRRVVLLTDSALSRSLVDSERLGQAYRFDVSAGGYQSVSAQVALPDGASGDYEISLRSEPVAMATSLQQASGLGQSFIHFRVKARARTKNGLESSHWRILKQLAPATGAQP